MKIKKISQEIAFKIRNNISSTNNNKFMIASTEFKTQTLLDYQKETIQVIRNNQ